MNKSRVSNFRFSFESLSNVFLQSILMANRISYDHDERKQLEERKEKRLLSLKKEKKKKGKQTVE